MKSGSVLMRLSLVLWGFLPVAWCGSPQGGSSHLCHHCQSRAWVSLHLADAGSTLGSRKPAFQGTWYLKGSLSLREAGEQEVLAWPGGQPLSPPCSRLFLFPAPVLTETAATGHQKENALPCQNSSDLGLSWTFERQWKIKITVYFLSKVQCDQLFGQKWKIYSQQSNQCHKELVNDQCHNRAN